MYGPRSYITLTLAIVICVSALDDSNAACRNCLNTISSVQGHLQHTHFGEDAGSEDKCSDRQAHAGAAKSGGVEQLSEYQHGFANGNSPEQQTMGEDWFLRPRRGNGVLHLNVPYGAEVRIVRQSPYDGGLARQSYVRGTKSKRHVVLRGVSTTHPEEIRVYVSVWPGSQDCGVNQETRCRKVRIMAGERRHLTVRYNEIVSGGREGCGSRSL